MYQPAHPVAPGPIAARPGSPGVPTWGVPGGATVGVGRDDQVSGEAVALELPPAGFGWRVASGLVDLIFGYLLWLGLTWLAGNVFYTADAALRGAAATLCVVLALVIIPTAIETSTRGKTLGHLIFGLRTVRDDAGPSGFRQSITRALLGVIEIYSCFGIPALLTAAVNRKSKRMGDLLAGTYVIRDRRKLRVPEPIVMPPPLASWAASADIRGLPDPLAVSIRRFLAGCESMKPLQRTYASSRLILAVAPYVAPAPPAAPDEAVLAAIIAERRFRDSERIARENRVRERLLG